MLELARRFLVVQALLVWQGGFTFYAAVVVPVGTDHLGSAREQGHITARVTDYLNAAGAVALGLLLLDQLVTPALRRARLAVWLPTATILVALAALHPRLDARLADGASWSAGRGAFRFEHGFYLWLSTAQWLLALAAVALTLAAWGRAANSPAPERPR